MSWYVSCYGIAWFHTRREARDYAGWCKARGLPCVVKRAARIAGADRDEECARCGEPYRHHDNEDQRCPGGKGYMYMPIGERPPSSPKLPGERYGGQQERG